MTALSDVTKKIAGRQAVKTGLQGAGRGVAGAAMGAGKAIGGVAQGLGSAIGGTVQAVGSAIGGALQGAMTPPDIVINNMGMAGTAGREKAAGGRNMPLTPMKKPSKPSVNEHQPTEKLLGLAIKYLSSIEDTLKNIMIFEQNEARRKASADREDMIEKVNSPGITSDKNMIQKLKDKAKKRASSLLKGLGLVALATAPFVIARLDEVDLEAMKEAVENFSTRVMESFNRIAKIAGAVLAVWSVIQLLPIFKALKLGKIAGGALAIGGGLLGGLGRFGKRLFAPKLEWKGASWVNPKTGKYVSAAQAAKWGYKIPSGRSLAGFIAFLEKRGYKTIAKRLIARAGAALASAAAGVFAAPVSSGLSLIWTLMQIGLTIWFAYDIVSTIVQLAYEYMGESGSDTNPVAKEDTFGNSKQVSNSSGGAYIPSGDKKVDFAMKYLMDNAGLTSAQAAGVVGNLYAESKLDTNAENAIGAFGIAQWLDRRHELEAYLKAHGYQMSDMKGQLEFLVHELKTKPYLGYSQLKQTKTSSDAATVFMNKFERPADSEKKSSIHERMSVAMAAEKGTSIKTAQSDYDSQIGSAVSGAVEAMKQPFSWYVSKLGAGFSKIAQFDTTYKPFTKSNNNKIDKLNEESRKAEVDAIAGLRKKAAENTSQPMSNYESSLRKANGGSLDVVNPNYMLDGDSIITNYLQYFELLR